eukprot:COSAG01_NODE_15179_length_1364_cov_3.302767_2_plen_75_part_00
MLLVLWRDVRARGEINMLLAVVVNAVAFGVRRGRANAVVHEPHTAAVIVVDWDTVQHSALQLEEPFPVITRWFV